MARRIGKYKVSTRVWDINQNDDANNTPATLAVGGGYGADGLTVDADGNTSTNGTLTVDGATTLSGNVDIGDAKADTVGFFGHLLLSKPLYFSCLCVSHINIIS